MVSNNRRTIIFIFVFFCLTKTITSQVWWSGGGLSEQDWNRNLVYMKTGDIVIDYYTRGFLHPTRVLASSWLAPEGNAPFKEDDPDTGHRWANAEWSSMYGPSKAFDGQLDTAWSEGVPGDGIGEVLIADLSPEKPLKIFTGYAKSKDLWLKNNRPRNIKIFILKSIKTSSNQMDSYPIDITVIDEQYATLKDVFDWQPLPVEKSKITFENREKSQDEKYSKKERDEYWEKRENYMIGIQILSVYQGTKYQDTLISEISYEDKKDEDNFRRRRSYYGDSRGILANPVDPR